MMDEIRANARVDLAKMLPLASACVEALSYFEPDISWNADVLAFRVRCYRASQATRMAKRAESDLQWFMAHRPTRLSAAGLE
jgi:hypothetical protein